VTRGDNIGYDQDRCEKILAYFGGSYSKAEKQYEKFQDKKNVTNMYFGQN